MTCCPCLRITESAARRALFYHGAGKFAATLVIALAVLFCAPHPAHAILTNGENAIDLLGEFASDNVTPTYTKSCANDGNGTGFDFRGADNPSVIIDSTNHRLFVSDSNNHRVLVFTLTAGNLISSKTPANVLGQPDFVSCGAATTQSGMGRISGMDFDPTNNRLFVADGDNSRVLVFSTSTITNGMNASYVLGQSNFTNGGSSTTVATMNTPFDVKYDSTNSRLFVADRQNNRVLVFNVATGTIANGENASFELGQPSGTAFTSATVATTQSGMRVPSALAYDSANTRLYVTDESNNRVLAFNVATGTIANGENASNELGQPSGTAFTSSTANLTQSGMSSPASLAYDSAHTRLFVGEFNNNRVTVFNTSTITNGMNAAKVLGQPDFLGNGQATSQSGLSGTAGLAYDSTNNQLYVADQGNNRVMIFNTNFPTTVSAITAPVNDACALTGGALYCWGYNGYGEDGFGNTTQYLSPQQVGALTTWTAISQSDPSYEIANPTYSTCALTGGALYCWGHNYYGELGLGNTTPFTTPQQVGTDTTWTVISQGSPDACGIDNGKLYCWGWNKYGELGLGNTTQFTTPQQVGALTTWTAVSQRGRDACGIAGGKLYCWGQNVNGEDGINSTTQQTTPLQVGALTTWTAVSQGGVDTCGIAGGALYCWGYNQYGELGLGNTTQFTTPQQVGALTTWTAVSVLNDGSTDGGACGIAGGKLYCWGQNQHGESGLGNTTQHTSPVQVGTDTTWTAISFGGSDACGIDNSILYCWGLNGQGEDGLGNFTQYSTPQAVSFGNGENASDLLGQYTSYTSTATVSYTQNPINGATVQIGLNNPSGVAVDAVNHRLFVADTNNNRVLVYNLNTDNSISSRVPANVLGEPNFATTTPGTTQYSMNQPFSVAFDSMNNRLFVSDRGSERVLVFNTATITNGMNAAYELGQPDFTTVAAVTTQSGMALPTQTAYDAINSRLFVDDYQNSRVLVFNVATGTIANGENASFELGQPSGTAFTSTTQATTQSGMSLPEAVAYDAVNSRLFVSDGGNSRVTVFNVAPGTIANGMNASNVLGTANFTTTGGGTTQSTVADPKGLSYDATNGRLFVADNGNVRVLVFDARPATIVNGENASNVVGQPDFVTGTGNVTQSGMVLDNGNIVSSCAVYDPATSRLFVSDTGNNRIMVFEGSFDSSDFLKLMPN